MVFQIERPMYGVVTRFAAASVAAGLALGPIVATANTTPAAEAVTAAQASEPDLKPAAGETVKAQASHEGAGSSSAGPAEPKTIEDIRMGMAQAQVRREALLKPDAAVADSAIHKELVEKWGVEVYGVRKAASGYMIDFRFRVLDAEKALPLFDPRTKPYLLTEGTHIKLPVPVGEKVGAFRTTNRGKNIQANKDYYMMFANPDSYVKPGQKVSVVIGDFRAEHMTLQ